VQAMPGYTNVLVMRFDRPGSYQIRCLELSGQYHHIMVRGFEVT
jgi:cytochrome c oxidase subunit II